MVASKAISLSEITVRPVRRLSTGITSLDWIFGSTGNDRTMSWGLPKGAMTLLSAPSGAGKSRLAIAIAAAITHSSHRILYCQSEVSLPQFKGWIGGQQPIEDLFLVSGCDDADSLTSLISDLRPSLVVIDSISMFNGIERQTTARRIIVALKAALEATGAHGLLLAHENARKQVKGGTLLPHLVDCVARIDRTGFADWVQFELKKNRFGPVGRSATFNHNAHGLAPVFVSDGITPMFQVRFDSETGAERRRVPIYGSGGKTIELDEDGRQILPPKKRFFRLCSS